MRKASFSWPSLKERGSLKRKKKTRRVGHRKGGEKIGGKDHIWEKGKVIVKERNSSHPLPRDLV